MQQLNKWIQLEPIIDIVIFVSGIMENEVNKSLQETEVEGTSEVRGVLGIAQIYIIVVNILLFTQAHPFLLIILF